MKICNKNMLYLQIDRLGMVDDVYRQYVKCLSAKKGAILVVGPERSGISTTLYASLGYLNNSSKKVVTLERPVEFNFFRINQVNLKDNADFKSEFSRILEMDSDIIMVDHAEKKEVLDSICDASNQGKLVLSSVYSNDIISMLKRLESENINMDLFLSNTICVLSRRLIRLLCPACKVKRDISAAERESLMASGIDIKDMSEVYDDKGCSMCNNSGYKEKTGIFELLVMDDDVKTKILNRDYESLKDFFVKRMTLKDDVFFKLKNGVTSPSEVLRALGLY